ncbi:hypothetical protein [Micromonospora avicenniae]|uniref:hypothetical protein n=1 Tax=Micromonospora avicenniae TaxID=1198245 RepID=UPI003333F0ED
MVPDEVSRGGISEEGRGSGRSPEVFKVLSSLSVAGRPGRCRPEVASRPGPGRRGPLAGRLDQGEELRTVMELLGHSTIRMTADTYGHVLPARARQAASAIDRVLGEEETA